MISSETREKFLGRKCTKTKQNVEKIVKIVSLRKALEFSNRKSVAAVAALVNFKSPQY